MSTCAQLALPLADPDERPTAGPDLAGYDYHLINSSAGKDSAATLAHVVRLADQAGVDRRRLVVVHADLGRVDWPGTAALAVEQATHYGLRIELVRRPQGDLLQQVEERGRWPSSTARYCTSDHKTGQVAKLMTRIVRDHRAEHGPAPVRILNILGIRADESRERAKKRPFHRDPATNGKRHVDRWLPIFDWPVEQVWDTIRAAGLPWHGAYDEGASRLSCALCVLASRSDLVLAARLNPDLAAEYAAVEARIGHRFRNDLSMADIIAAAGADAAQDAPL